MKLLCIKESGYFLTPGKIYDAESYDDSDLFSYWVFNDRRVRHGVEDLFFVELSKVRNEKLEALGI
jgi:hypothetical protein